MRLALEEMSISCFQFEVFVCATKFPLYALLALKSYYMNEISFLRPLRVIRIGFCNQNHRMNAE